MEAVLTEHTIKLKSRGDFRLTFSFPKILEWVKLPQKKPFKWGEPQKIHRLRWTDAQQMLCADLRNDRKTD